VYCPHHPEGGWLGELPELKRECHCRKPDVEMFELLAAKYQIDLSSSFYAGDSRNDLLAAERLSIPFTLIDSSSETNRVNALKKFLDGVKSLVNS
jgi:histidinol phosphatase-like enzyme